jgi:hypothetical protein
MPPSRGNIVVIRVSELRPEKSHFVPILLPFTAELTGIRFATIDRERGGIPE